MTKPKTPEPTAPRFDGAALARQTWLTGPEAAFYMGYRSDRYKNVYNAWAMFRKRNNIRRGFIGGRAYYRRTELDRLIQHALDAGQA